MRCISCALQAWLKSALWITNDRDSSFCRLSSTNCIYSERFKYFQSLLSHFFHARCSVHVHACLFFPSQLAFSTVPPWHLPASNQLTQLTNGLQVAGSSMSTHFDFFLSVYVHWAKKELRGFTSSQDSCVPYSCVVHLRLRIKSLLFR